MKKSLVLFCAIIISYAVKAQSPQSFGYQGIARNSVGNPISNQLISIKASILDASATGPSQYTEVQSVTTNSLGLFSISIGLGTVQTGTFSAITWSTGLKFMKVEFDPAGGTTYILSGTQQILSVPYALHALNAKTYVAGIGVSVSGSTITNTAPNQIVNISSTGISTVSGTYPNYTLNTPNHTAGVGIAVVGNTITNTAPNQTVNISATGISTVTGTYPNYTVNTPNHTAGSGIAVVGNTITNTAPNQTVTINGSGNTSVSGTYPNFSIGSPIYIAGNGISIISNTISISNPTLTIGSTFAGGVVFYLDATGKHGLVCAINDQGTNNWIPSTTWTNTAIYSSFDCYNCGEANSRIASNLFGSVSSAFQVCSAYSTGIYSDWYLPSRYELTLMYLNLKTIGLGSFSNGWYWTSTESGPQTAWVINFTNGSYSAGYSKWGSPGVIVRPIRAF